MHVVTATKPIHGLQIRPTVHNWRAPPTIPPSYIRVCAVVGMQRGTDRQTDRQTDGCDQYIFCPSAMPHVNVTTAGAAATTVGFGLTCLVFRVSPGLAGCPTDKPFGHWRSRYFTG